MSLLSGQVGQNPQSLDTYFQEAQTAKNKGQMNLHKKLVDKLDELLVGKSKILTSSKIS